MSSFAVRSKTAASALPSPLSRKRRKSRSRTASFIAPISTAGSPTQRNPRPFRASARGLQPPLGARQARGGLRVVGMVRDDAPQLDGRVLEALEREQRLAQGAALRLELGLVLERAAQRLQRL